jgi:hypothetical protein
MPLGGALVLGLSLLRLAELLLGPQAVLRFLSLTLGIGLAPEQPLQAPSTVPR